MQGFALKVMEAETDAMCKIFQYDLSNSIPEEHLVGLLDFGHLDLSPTKHFSIFLTQATLQMKS